MLYAVKKKKKAPSVLMMLSDGSINSAATSKHNKQI